MGWGCRAALGLSGFETRARTSNSRFLALLGMTVLILCV
jgi:hypothetical protein